MGDLPPLDGEGGMGAPRQDVVDLLIRHGAAVDKRNKEGSTALTLARHYRHRKAPRCLAFCEGLSPLFACST